MNRVQLTSVVAPLTIRNPVHIQTGKIKAFGDQDGPFSRFKMRVEDALFNSDPEKDTNFEASPDPEINTLRRRSRQITAALSHSLHTSPSHSPAPSKSKTKSKLPDFVRNGAISKSTWLETSSYFRNKVTT